MVGLPKIGTTYVRTKNHWEQAFNRESLSTEILKNDSSDLEGIGDLDGTQSESHLRSQSQHSGFCGNPMNGQKRGSEK